MARSAVAVAVLAVASIILAACSGPSAGPAVYSSTTGAPTSHKVLKVAWINEGQAGNDLWTKAHAEGRGAVQDTFGDQVETTFAESIQPDSASETIDDLVAEGNTMIFATSFPLNEAMLQAADRFPEVHFAQARGVETRANLATFSGADEEPIYLAGMAAGATTNTGRIGFVGTVPEPETVRHIDAFTLGARSVRPETVVEVAWINSWWDPETERKLALQLIDGGADVLASGSISTVGGEVARQSDAAWVGHDADHLDGFPVQWLTGAVPDWSNYYVDQVRLLTDGTWGPSEYYGDMTDGYTSLARLGTRVPETVRPAIAEAEAGLRTGDLAIFAGPIRDQSGQLRVASGEALTAGDLAQIDWLTEGTAGSSDGT